MTQTPTLPTFLHRQDEFSPDPSLTRLREEGRLVRVNTPFAVDAWLVTRVQDVREVLADTARVSNVIPPGYMPTQAGMSQEEIERARAGNPLAMDPPDHTRLRRLLTPSFTMRQMRLLEPRVQHIVEEHLAAMESAGAPADLVQAFALPIPSLVICELLGVPYEGRAEFQRLSNRLLDLTLPPRARQEAQWELRAYITGLITRESGGLREGILTALIRDHGESLSPEELTGIGVILLIAGHETTANMLGLGTLALLRHPEQLAIVRDRPDLADAAVEELLRWLSIVTTALTRITVEPIEIAGQRIEAGELLLMSLPAANRDPGLVSAPDVLDVTRGEIGHLAFGHGLHHCLGAPLARMELRIALPALLRRFPGLRLADPDTAVQFRGSSLVYGVTSLPVAW